MAIQNPVIRQMIKSATLLSLFMLMGISLLLWVAHITQPKIEQAQKDNLIKTFNQIIPHSEYDNDPLNDTLIIKAPKSLALLGTRTPVTIYRLRKNGRPVAAIFPITAPDGYSGPIKLLIGIYRNGRIAGVRVLEERETPGLGDKIELKKSPWILSFNGRQLTPENESRWAVKKDHGMFDQFTGATITPRAVVKAIKHALIFVNQMGDKLYE